MEMLVNNIEDELLEPDQLLRRSPIYYLQRYNAGPPPNADQQQMINELKDAFEASRLLIEKGEEIPNQPRLFFWSGEGGSGKTFTENVIKNSYFVTYFLESY